MLKLKLFFVVLLVHITLFMFGQEKQYRITAVGFYNLENLFDTLDTPDVRDTEFTPKGSKTWNSTKYHKKLNNLATVLSDLATEESKDGVSILGVSEIENRSVLDDLVKHPLIKARNYQVVHKNSPDKRGIDVGLIYDPNYFELRTYTAIPLLIYEEDTGERIFTRDILHVEGFLYGDEIHILVNHWPSRRGGEKRTSKLREAGAKVCKQVYDSLARVNPEVNLIVMGDLNDDPVNRSVKKQLLAKANKDKVREGEMYNPMHAYYKQGYGSNAYRDAWSLFDQVILSEGLLDRNPKELFYYKAEVYNKSYLIQKEGKYKAYPKRTFSGDTFINGYSDHFPVFVYLLKQE